MLIEITKGGSDTLKIYAIEFVGKDSALVKIELSADFVGGLRALAASEQ
jgi:hypothetical protein